jgi:hypothetical protein
MVKPSAQFKNLILIEHRWVLESHIEVHGVEDFAVVAMGSFGL